MYTAADTADLEEVINYLNESYCLDKNGNRIRRMSAVGVSLGASVLALYSARVGESNPLESQCGVSCFFDSMIAF